jgi:carnitine O-acetyltransferase
LNNYFRYYKIPSAQYEAAALRMFQRGRTETIRSCSIESVNFARIMLDPEAKDIDKATALKDAVNSHKKYVGQVSYIINNSI